MSFKNRNCSIFLLILLLCILLVVVSLIFHQFLLLSYLILIYWVILSLLLGIPHIHTGIKELREARQNGQSIPWQQNTHILQGIKFVLPSFIVVSSYFSSGYHPGNSNWPIIDLILTICISVFLVPIIFFEIIFTVSAIRHFLNRANPYEQYLQSISTEEQSFEE